MVVKDIIGLSEWGRPSSEVRSAVPPEKGAGARQRVRGSTLFVTGAIKTRTHYMTCGQGILIPILETGESAYETHLHIIHLTATVLGCNEFGQTTDVVTFGILAAVQIIFRTVNEAYDIGVLLDGT